MGKAGAFGKLQVFLWLEWRPDQEKEAGSLVHEGW